MAKTVTKIDAIPVPVKRKKVAAYARVSMESERLQHSLSAQVSYYSELIQSNPEWEYAGVYADSGISGTETEKRSEFNRLMEDCENHLVDIVLTKSISRFARNTVDLLNTVRHLKELGVEVRFEKEGINSMSGDGELMLSILASFAQEESHSISENCKWGIRKMYEQGKPRNCMLYGYRVVNGKLTIKEDEAEVVRHIFQLFLEGDSCYVISQKLEKEGAKSYRGKPFKDAVIMRMIRQEKYTGCTMGQKFYAENHITHKQVKNKGELPMYYMEQTHPAIISYETFQAAQEEFAKRYGVEVKNGIAETASYLHHTETTGKKDPPHRSPQWSEERRKSHHDYFSKRENNDNEYAFSRFITCEGCGCHLWAHRHHYSDGTEDVKWVCNDHRLFSPESDRSCQLRESVLKKQIAEEMGMAEFDENEMHKQLKGISAIKDRVTLHYKDGTIKTFVYVPPKMIRSTKEKADSKMKNERSEE